MAKIYFGRRQSESVQSQFNYFFKLRFKDLFTTGKILTVDNFSTEPLFKGSDLFLYQDF